MRKLLAGLFATLLLAGCAIPTPGAFYHGAATTGARPGQLLRVRRFIAAPSDARAYQVIYASTAPGGGIVAVSGVIFVPRAPPPAGGRNIVAWAHPTTGVAAGCAPSLGNRTFGGRDLAGSIPGLQRFLRAGDIVTATDYQGLGVAGVHPYLIGAAEADDLIDSVRAARRLPGAAASRRFGVWGHSQGGQAALFAGQVAGAYAPGLRLVGVAAAAPPTALGPELTAPFTSDSGRLLSAYVYDTWSRVYGVPITSIVAPAAVAAVRRGARRCINSIGQYIVAARAAAALDPVFIAHDPQTTPPWPTLFAENSPGHAPAGAPLLITQGTADTTVYPVYTDRFVRRACARGDVVDYVPLKGVGHLFAGYRSAHRVAAWFARRFAGVRPRDGCAAARTG